MKKQFLIATIVASSFAYAQSSWNLTGNSGTNASTNFLGTSDTNDLVLKTNNQERFRINSIGNVGIGTNPELDIILKLKGRTQFFSDINSDTFAVQNTGANIDAGASLVWLSYSQYQPNNPGVLDVSGPTAPGIWESTFSLKANGKLLIGNYSQYPNCSDCNDYRVFIKNGIRTEKIKVDIAASNGWADYVFEKNYNLMPLNELEKFITENKHLPEVPTTKEAIENGIELKEMNILLLKKVEELTLYVIQQQKELQELKLKVKKDEE
ncbi:hypothetical protein [Chryseobacterium scophthalmum]|uniref:hypothetical protein n=1 Tax=Chryseobacterium scophthalmum TaxID=59733 RepID=UPI001AEBE5C3|nr:hypothetical protein [Chryseobacterium scophthalmum]